MIIKNILLAILFFGATYSQDIKQIFIPTIETERCILRPISLDDTNILFNLASNEQVCKYTTMFDGKHKNIEDSRDYIQKILDKYSKNKNFSWIIIDKKTDEFLGLIDIEYSSKHRRAELGYALLPLFWNKGLTTEASTALIKFGFNQLHIVRFEATADPRNIGSCRVLEKCGMKLEGRLRNFYIVNYEICDRNIYSITLEEYFKKRYL